jgi:phosphatidylserine decarboxylase
MRIHKEGGATILITALVLLALNMTLHFFLGDTWLILIAIIHILSFGLWLFIISFFRIPARKLTKDANLLVSPCDGKVVVIEEVIDQEYFKTKRLQVSVFMSPANVHVNLNPIDGEVVYNQYHPGKYLVAWDPKSSTENERHSVVLKSKGKEVLVKQIAGALAKRIVNYLTVGQQVKQSEELGFIKFGSRVDLLLPPDAEILVDMNQKVKGGVTPIAKW